MRNACKYFILIHLLLVTFHSFINDYMGGTSDGIILSIAMLASIPALFGIYDIVVPEHGKLLILLVFISTMGDFLSEMFFLEAPLLKIFFIFYLIVYSAVGVMLLRKPVPWVGSADES